jgi:hypothetical protein
MKNWKTTLKKIYAFIINLEKKDYVKIFQKVFLGALLGSLVSIRHYHTLSWLTLEHAIYGALTLGLSKAWDLYSKEKHIVIPDEFKEEIKQFLADLVKDKDTKAIPPSQPTEVNKTV